MEPRTSQGLSSLPGRGSDGVSQTCKHDDLAFKTHQLALGSTTTPTFQLFPLSTLSPWRGGVLGFPREDPMLLTSRGKACPCHLLTLGPKALLIRFWDPGATPLLEWLSGRIHTLVGTSTDPPHYPYSTENKRTLSSRVLLKFPANLKDSFLECLCMCLLPFSLPQNSSCRTLLRAQLVEN